MGAIAGVGLWEGRKGLNLRLTAKYVAGWVITIIAVICLSCALMAQGLYSPNKNCSNERSTIAVYLNDTANAIATVLPATEAAVSEPARLLAAPAAGCVCKPRTRPCMHACPTRQLTLLRCCPPPRPLLLPAPPCRASRR